MINRSELRGVGIASSTPFTDDERLVAEEARHVEDLGFAMLWRSGVLPMVEVAVRSTRHIPVGTGIIAVSNVASADVVDTYHRLHHDHPGRFVVGLGGAHDEHPMRTLGGYLDALDEGGVPAGDRVLAALGPNMIGLARDRARGAYPYLVTPSYTADARARLGPDHLLAVLLMTVPSTDRERVRSAVAGPLEFLAAAGGYRRNLRRWGFGEADIDDVSDRLLDGIVAWGDDDAIAERIEAYRTAGADQVVLRILGADDDLPAARERLARAVLE